MNDSNIPNVFTRKKNDGGKRIILNLKQFNTNIAYHHFIMEFINQVLHIIRSNVYMASIDSKDALYLILIYSKHQKYLKFVMAPKIYQYTCTTNGCGPIMLTLTKITKVPFLYWHKRGCISAVLVDDLYL